MRRRQHSDLYTPEYEELLAKGQERNRKEQTRFAELRKSISAELKRRHRKPADAPPVPLIPPVLEDRSFPTEQDSPAEPSPPTDTGQPEGGPVEGAPPQHEPLPAPTSETMDTRRAMFRTFVSSQLMLMSDGIKRLGGEPPSDAMAAMIAEMWTMAAESNGWLSSDLSPKLALWVATGSTAGCYGLPIVSAIQARRRQGKVNIQ